MKHRSFIHSSRVPLSLRLTASFIVFGILIAYVAFIMASLGGSRRMVEHYQQHVHNVISGEDDLLKTFRNDILLHDLFDRLSTVFQAAPEAGFLQQSLKEIALYSRDVDESAWTRAATLYSNDGMSHLADGNPVQAGAGNDSRADLLLNDAAQQGIAHDLGFFYGQTGLFSLYINLSSYTLTMNSPAKPVSEGAEITAAYSGSTYILRLMFSRAGIADLFRNFLPTLIGMTLFICVVSLVLSQFFVRKIVRPIRWLAKEADQAARGKRDRRFSIRGRDSIAQLGQALDSMMTEIDYQFERIQHQADTLETMNSIDKAVLSSGSRSELLQRVTEVVGSLYPENGLFLFLKNRQKGCFEFLHEQNGSRRYGESSEENLGKNSGDGTAEALAGDDIPFAEVTGELRSFMEHGDSMRIRIAGVPQRIRTVIPAGSEWLLNIPIYLRDEYYGSLMVTSDLRDGFPEEEIDIIAKMTDQVGVALQSLVQVEEKEALLYGALQALSASIDAKSRWTAGHSSRVRTSAEVIGGAARLSALELNKLSIAALLHDVGKIGIPEQVLDKPGKLTDEEYELIKTHPTLGVEIFGHIPTHPEIADGIRYHHEHWNGRGYPEGLSGENIPLIARILCVADVYDAISADRPYRSGMSRDEVRAFFIARRGIMFDPQLTDLFLELYDSRRI